MRSVARTIEAVRQRTRRRTEIEPEPEPEPKAIGEAQVVAVEEKG
jgi:hypothetical protein